MFHLVVPSDLGWDHSCICSRLWVSTVDVGRAVSCLEVDYLEDGLGWARWGWMGSPPCRISSFPPLSEPRVFTCRWDGFKGAITFKASWELGTGTLSLPLILLAKANSTASPDSRLHLRMGEAAKPHCKQGAWLQERWRNRAIFAMGPPRFQSIYTLHSTCSIL